MNKIQVSIFDVINTNKYEIIKQSLSNYSIDDVYIQKFSDKDNPSLKNIEESLTEITDYKDYISTLFTKLKQYIPIVDCSPNFNEVGMYYTENTIRIKQKSKHYTIWCLEMLDKKIFEELE